MTTQQMSQERTTHVRGARPRLNLTPRVRKAVLTLHIVSAAAWIGIDVMVACFVAVGASAGDPETRGLAYQALAEFVVVPMLVSSLVCLATGLILGLATKWGLVRYWWVLVKLAMNLVLCTLITFSLRPGMGEVRAYGDRLVAGDPVVGDVSDLAMPPIVSLTALTLAVVLSVYKPWGRVRAVGSPGAAARRGRP